MKRVCRLLISGAARLVGFVALGWVAILPARAEIIVAPGEGIGIPLVVHSSALAVPSTILYYPQTPLLAPLPGGGGGSSGALRSSQSNVSRSLWHAEDLRRGTSAPNHQTIILLSR